MISNLQSLLNSGAIFSGQIAHVELDPGPIGRDFRIGVLEMMNPSVKESSEVIVLHFVWLAKHDFKKGYFDGERGKKIEIPVKGLVWDNKVTHCYCRRFIGVVLRNGKVSVSLYTAKFGTPPKEPKSFLN